MCLKIISTIVIAQWFPRKNPTAGVHDPYKSIMFIPYYNRQASILFHNIIFMDQEFCNLVIYFIAVSIVGTVHVYT